ncbi:MULTISPECIES: hypothetical protein [unclassified Bosea (in: a-proteobacteria)]|uniref:hypothetical protein n=1 Tax=unclassified Bosea (in: a-proteobacteria) TaxID=2653178 RepID=UPI000F760ACD|nr:MULTISPECIES: hypothetical protein [unclassified Bosea (in: a-proteobacteria)]AZO79072.1 hypothetical protein BLM15_16695 [Bosea sp. Tri-49]RXT27537.1 hypothetical protein B5U98_01655 [Bosea sp. Tri-39]RXT35758.1 hypothetical protein B5U99_16345 [Bosea sp. Tri-54]
MAFIQSSRFLRNALALDAAACAGTGLLLSVGAGSLSGLLGFPAEFLRGAGLVLLPCAVLLAFFASRTSLPRLAVYAVIGVNILWVADSVLILVAGWFAPTTLGIAFVLAQAAAVAVVTELEVIGLKKSVVDAENVQTAH